ncbi:MAG: hypothetical protein Kow0075_07580 [Salibacteraceae bacterium]
MRSLAFYFVLIAVPFTGVKAQIQVGGDIDGEAAGDWSGYSVSMPDRYTVAIGAPYNSGAGAYHGHVRVFKWNGSAWVQKGTDLDGEAYSDRSGYSVSMPDSNTVAIGEPLHDGNGNQSGRVRVFVWKGNSWVQKGAGIVGEHSYDKAGRAVCMPDSNTVAVATELNGDNGDNAGHVRIFTWNGSTWVQKGADIDGEAAGDESGFSISMPNANTIAIGAPLNDGNGNNAGHVRVFEWTGTAWTQKGADIEGAVANDRFGYSVSMPTPDVFAAGAPFHDLYKGHVRVFSWNGSSWVQEGSDVDGDTYNNQLGWSVSMPSEDYFAAGAPIENVNDTMTGVGHVRVFTKHSNDWVQLGSNVVGEGSNDQSGWSISMPDEQTCAIGAPYNDGNGVDAGHVRIYGGFYLVGIADDQTESMVSVYPNPTNGMVNVSFESNPDNAYIKVYSPSGKLIQQHLNITTNVHQLEINQATGVYFVEVATAGESRWFKVVLQR